MEIIQFKGDITTTTVDLLVVGRFIGEEQSEAEQLIDEALKGSLQRRAHRTLFTGRSGQILTMDTASQISADRVVLLGLGERSAWGAHGLRDRAADVAREAISSRSASVAIALPETEHGGEAIALGLELGSYRFDQHQTPSEDHPKHEVSRVMIKGDFSEGEVERGKILADAVNLARTLVNEPPNVCTPSRLAELAVSMGGDDVQVTVLGKAEIEARGMGGVIAVSQGATEEPKFIHIHYRPSGESRGSLALIGKGLTFDSGGLSLKPPKSQEMMHIDMGGAAAVLGAMRAICSLKPDVEVHGIVGSCENMPDGNSYRPSDILTMYSKKTVEVLNTDAEGRLVLADALHYATELNPDAMVNLATLTGACMVGLGTNYCGLFSDNDAWAGALLAAGERAGEKLWRLPLDEGLADTLKSKRADIKNLGGPYGGAITAALFLKNFKGECTWAHMDIAGPVTADKAKGVISAGGTGFGVLTLVDLAEQFSPIVETAAP